MPFDDAGPQAADEIRRADMIVVTPGTLAPPRPGHWLIGNVPPPPPPPPVPSTPS
ncbi:MAG: hypothetical protein AB7O45_11050 [Alphaproteobacteria bacterium]